MTIFCLIAVAILESIVMLWRVRAGVGVSAVQAGLSAAAVCGTRMLWLGCGFSAWTEGRAVVAGLAYCLSAFASTWAVHGWKGNR